MPVRDLPAPPFPDDTGAADPELVARLASSAQLGTVEAYAAALTTLTGSRLLVPVVAVLGDSEVGADGLAREKSADMAAVLLQGADGRLALLAFTSTESLAAWDAQARPVPVPAPTAALAAVQEQAAALVVDVAGPTRFVVEDDALHALAAAGGPPRPADSSPPALFD